MNCSRCSRPIGQGLRFCENCGAAVASVSGGTQAASNTKRWVFIGLGGLFALVLVVGVVSRFASQAKDGPPKVGRSAITLKPVDATPALLQNINGKYFQDPEMMASLGTLIVKETQGGVDLEIDTQSLNWLRAIPTMCSLGGLAKREGNMVTLSNDEFGPCKLRIKFTGDKAEIDQDGECGCGIGASMSGTFTKTSPQGKEKYHGFYSYGHCMTDGTPADKLFCSAGEFERTDVRLNNEYKRVIAHYKTQGREDKVAALRKVELAWLKEMTLECGTTPSKSQEDINDCRLGMTGTRADELAKLP